MRPLPRLSLALRKHTRAFLPPALVRWAKRRTQPRFLSFADAQNKSPHAYDDEPFTQFRLAKAKLNLARARSESLPQGYTLLLAAMALETSEEPHLCDFGGACGEWVAALRRDLPHRAFRATVVETASLARACDADEYFTWAKWTSEMPATCDVFLASGSLQYTADPYAVLGDALTRTRHLVVLARTLIYSRPYFDVQHSPLTHNGFGTVEPVGHDARARVSYPRQALVWSRVETLLQAHGFAVKLKLHQGIGANGALHQTGADDEPFEVDLLLARNFAAPTAPASRL